MRVVFAFVLLSLVGLLGTAPSPAAAAADARAQVHHDLEVRIDPASHALEAVDRMTFPQGLDGLDRATDGALLVTLHANLGLDAAAADIRVECVGDVEGAGVPLRLWAIRPAEGDTLPASVALTWTGTIHHPPQAESEEYARSFARSPGTIGNEGVVLTRATWWVPHVGEDLLDFRMEVTLPSGWDAVSQGRRVKTSAAGSGTVGYECPHPMEEVYLIANRYERFARSGGGVEAEAYLLKPDANLANRYLEATLLYLDMYRRLIGPYPFAKFALVENFWETGYGMPSFTLLGPTVIRLPFILHSSYPHEILHNWWGNSVYVDWQTGNWCEGLTAYLADHLIKEGQGRGEEYRFDTLKKYRAYVNDGRDFPLTEFRSRHSGATEAVGYGKSLMLFHMLRRHLGDALFTAGLQRFYAEQRWRSASFEDLQKVFSAEARHDLEPFFQQWVERTGAPSFEVEARLEDHVLEVRVRQVQAGEPYHVTVPVAVTYAGTAEAHVVDVRMRGEREGAFVLEGPALPVRIDVDPSFDVFRRLDAAETPPTLGELFGAEAVTLVVPAEDAPLAAAWRSFAEAWSRTGGTQARVVAEDALEALPSDGAVWVLGARNRWAEAVQTKVGAFGAGVDAARVRLGETSTARAEHSWVLVARREGAAEGVLGWVGSEVEAALPGLARKLPHYGKYSFLAFQGTAPDNVAKGQWPALSSPMTVLLHRPADGSIPARGSLATREPLARLEPAFASERLMAHVTTLADERFRGRGAGDPMLDEAADYVARGFEAAGLVPGGDDGTWFQSFVLPEGPDGTPVTLKNVVGVLPGTKAAWSEQSVVVGAHYDHLGLGWPDVRSGHEGKIHNGADDNASGVAVLLELARVLGGELKPDRSLVFVAFSGEEAGRAGSKHYAQATSKLPAAKATAMINLDTVGRLGTQKLTVLGAGTATEWRHIAMGIGFTTGVESNCVPEDPQGSDQVSFHEIGVPAVQLFTGAHADYHRSTDDVEKIDADGLAKVAVFTREALVYLAARPEPLTSTLAGAAAPASVRPPSARRTSLGTVPDFAFRGPGIKVTSVIPGSAAAEAGLQPGDVLLAIDGTPLESLRHYSNVLKEHTPDDVVTLRIEREGATLEMKATLRAR